MINQLKQILNEEQLKIVEASDKKTIDKAVLELNKWAEKQLGRQGGYINDTLVAETLINYIQGNEVKDVKIEVPKEQESKTIIPKPKKEIKKEPKPPKKKVAKKFKEENQVGFGFDLDVQEVEQKPIWEL